MDSFEKALWAMIAFQYGLVFLGGLGLSAWLLLLLRPLLRRYALARPNARSSHREPTPQGGGIAILTAALISFLLIAHGLRPPTEGAAFLTPYAPVLVAAIMLACVGGLDDIRPLSPWLRLILQGLAVALAIMAAPWPRLLPDFIPAHAETALLVLAGVYFLNAVNFMDGLDWLTVAALSPMLGLSAVLLFDYEFGVHSLSLEASLLATALLGGLLGFAPFNKPVAKLFMGDVGSLPLGFLTGWLLYGVASRYGLIVGLLPALYYIADTGLTLLRRLLRGQKVWQAHREHFYQRATDKGLSVMAVSACVLAINLVLAALAAGAALHPSPIADMAALTLGILLVAGLLLRFSAMPKTPETASQALS